MVSAVFAAASIMSPSPTFCFADSRSTLLLLLLVFDEAAGLGVQYSRHGILLVATYTNLF